MCVLVPFSFAHLCEQKYSFKGHDSHWSVPLFLRVYPHDGLNPSFPRRTAHHVTLRHGFVPPVPRPRTSRTENAKPFFALGFARTNRADLAESAIVGLATSTAICQLKTNLSLQLKSNSATKTKTHKTPILLLAINIFSTLILLAPSRGKINKQTFAYYYGLWDLVALRLP